MALMNNHDGEPWWLGGAEYREIAPDVTLVLGQYKWEVHSEVLSHRSEFFKKALNGSFKEASSKTIVLFDDDPAIILRLIQSCYGDSITSRPLKSRHPHVIRFHTRQNGLVSTFDEDLENYDRRTHLENLIAMFKIADKYMAERLVNEVTSELCHHICNYLTEIDPFVMSSDSEVIGDITYEVLARYEGFKENMVDYLTNNPKLMQYGAIQELIAFDPQIAVRLCYEYADKVQRLKEQRNFNSTTLRNIRKLTLQTVFQPTDSDPDYEDE